MISPCQAASRSGDCKHRLAGPTDHGSSAGRMAIACRHVTPSREVTPSRVTPQQEFTRSDSKNRVGEEHARQLAPAGPGRCLQRPHSQPGRSAANHARSPTSQPQLAAQWSLRATGWRTTPTMHNGSEIWVIAHSLVRPDLLRAGAVRPPLVGRMGAGTRRRPRHAGVTGARGCLGPPRISEVGR